MLVASEPPLYFRIVRDWIAADRRGGYRLTALLEWAHRKYGVLNRAAWFDLYGTPIAVPLDFPQLIRKDRLESYESTQIACLAELAGSGEWTMIDCGADIGLFARKLIKAAPGIKRVVAIEPNPRSAALTKLNLDERLTGISSEVVHAAVSDFVGTANLVQPTYDVSPHAKHIDRSGGETNVVTIDSLGIPGDRSLLLKIDVEGEELATLRGAALTLRKAPRFIIQIEAHVDVVERNGIDPMEAVRFVNGIRPVDLLVVHDTKRLDIRLDLDRPFFDQQPLYRSSDIVMLGGF